MSISFLLLLFVGLGTVLLYNRASISVACLSSVVFLSLVTLLTETHPALLFFFWCLTVAAMVVFAYKPLRAKLFSTKVLRLYRKLMPRMSQTEKDALEAGDVSFESEIFSGAPNWNRLHAIPKATLSAEEQAFLDGPVESLCEMLNDFDITHNLADLPPAVWQYMKEQKFFGMIIPKQFGGLEFSAYAHARVLIKIGSVSCTAASTVSVPNSLGPAELLYHYGTQDQKDYYLPRLAVGQEIPCFALTSPEAGSDAASMPDYGVVCQGEHNGESVLGIKLNWNKRYITLAPVATLLGLAFKLYDPDGLLGSQKDIGITCALIPTTTPGITIGRRHLPLNAPFQNGPTQGKDVFIPLSYVIGGESQVGNGWRMLMECLAAGRAISLPSNAIAGAKMASVTAGAYARVRRQFNTSISNFEGIQELLARATSCAYISESAQALTCAVIDSGLNPSVLSAILKYHATENGRQAINDAMDIHGGKGICLGENNYLGRGYQAIPIMITVEGANVLTRNLIIYGQGATRCHPFVFDEMQAANDTDEKRALRQFDKAFFGHVGYLLSNVVRTVVLSLTRGFTARAPKSSLKRGYQHISRLSAAFALVSDVAMLVVGADLKRKESLSAKLGDVFSHLFLASSVLKRFHDDGECKDDMLLAEFALSHSLHQAQTQLRAVLRNFPNKPVAFLLNCLIFPLGAPQLAPTDKQAGQLAKQMSSPSTVRDSMLKGLYVGQNCQEKPIAVLIEAFRLACECQELERRYYKALKQTQILALDVNERLQKANEMGIITEDETHQLQRLEQLRRQLIDVDDFATEELAREVSQPDSDRKRA